MTSAIPSTLGYDQRDNQSREKDDSGQQELRITEIVDHQGNDNTVVRKSSMESLGISEVARIGRKETWSY